MSTDVDPGYRGGALLGGIVIGVLLWWGYAAVAVGWGAVLLVAGRAIGARYDPRAAPSPDPTHATASARAIEALGIATLLGLPALVVLDVSGTYDPGALLVHAGYGAGTLYGVYGLARLRERARDRRC